MKKVHVVMWKLNGTDDYGIEGIYSSEEAAKNLIEVYKETDEEFSYWYTTAEYFE